MSALLAGTVASEAALLAWAQKGADKAASASNEKNGPGDRSRDRNNSKSKKKKGGESNCPPDWMRETHGTGVQVGTGQPDHVLPIGCHEND